MIIGGGVTGVAMFHAAVRHRIAGRIDIVDPLPPGTGTAFANSHPALLCNTSSGIMSLLADAPHDFLRYLLDQRLDVSADDFVPRRLFSEYVRSRYAAQVARHMANGGSHRHIAGRAATIRREGESGYRILLDNGHTVVASDVLICRGYGEPAVPDVLSPHLGKDLIFRSPFPEGPLLQAMPQRARVLVLGTRLSAIDAALLLCGQDCTVTMASPSGQLPAVRARTGRGRAGLVHPADITVLDLAGPGLHRDVLALVQKATAVFSPRPLRHQITTVPETVQRLRAEIHLAEQGHTDWQDTLCSIVDAVNEALTPMDKTLRDTALNRCGLFSRYLAAFPLSNARKVLAHLDSGLLQVRTGAPLALRPGKRWLVTWPDGAAEQFDAIVSATGYHTPQLHVEGTTLHLLDNPTQPCRTPTVHPDLRITLPQFTQPERIWLLGISSSVRVPSINAVYPMVQQTDRLCRQLTTPQPAQRQPAPAVNEVDPVLR